MIGRSPSPVAARFLHRHAAASALAACALLSVSVAFSSGADAQVGPVALPAQEGTLFGDVPDACPADAPADWVWTDGSVDGRLSAIDLEGEATTFGLLADFEGTSIIIRVRDAATNENLGVIKTDTSNTSTDGEVYAWRLARALGFDAIVAPTIPVTLRAGALVKIRELLQERTYADANKERNRQRVLAEINDAIRTGGSFTGAFKIWVPSFMFHGGVGQRDRLADQPMTPYLAARAEQPPSELVVLQQFTRLYSPQGTHRGEIAIDQLAEDFSNIMVLDALMGQNDRFAGANLHMQSVGSAREQEGERRGLPIWNLGEVRLLALDNGASMRSRSGSGIADLQGNVDPATRVERFERETVEKLRWIARRVIGYGCDAPASDDEVSAAFAALGVESPSMRERARGYMEQTLAYIDDLEARYGDAIYFERSTTPDEAPSPEDGSASPDDSEAAAGACAPASQAPASP